MLRKILLDNLTQKAFALVMAIVLVFFVREDKTSLVTSTVRVRVSHPDDRVLVSPLVEKVTITVEGKYSAVRDFDTDRLPALDVTLTGREEQFSFEPEMFKVPPGLKVRAMRPAAMLVKFEPRKTQSVPVAVRIVGEPPPGYRVTAERVEPAMVDVDGAASSVAAVSRVHTSPIDLSGRTQETTRVVVPLEPEPPNVRFLGPPQYTVTLTIDEITGTRVVTGRPVSLKGEAPDGHAYELSPSAVDITLHGRVRLVDPLDAGKLVAYVEAKDINPKKRLQTLAVHVDAPEGVSVVSVTPKQITLVPKRVVEPPPEEEGPDAGPAPPRKEKQE